MKKLLLSLLLVCGICHADTIEMVVTASPGGPDDTVSRKVVELIEKNSNLKIVTINKPGAAHTIGYNYAHTNTKPLLIMSTPAIAEHVEVLDGLTELHNLGYFYNTLYVNKSSNVKNIKDLTNREITFGHGGIGSYSYLAMKSVCEKQLKCLDIPFKSAAEGMMALMSNTIDAYAVVSYGSKQYSDNDRIVPIYKIRTEKSKSWFKLYGKNLTKDDDETIRKIMESVNPSFYTDLGFMK